MQEEIENRTVTLIISAVKLTARELKAGMDKYLSEKKSKAMEKARAAPEKPSGKQTVRQLIGQNQGVYPKNSSPSAESRMPLLVRLKIVIPSSFSSSLIAEVRLGWAI